MHMKALNFGLKTVDAVLFELRLTDISLIFTKNCMMINFYETHA